MLFESFFPLFGRLLGCFNLSPLLSRLSLPFTLKMGLTLALTLLFSPFIKTNTDHIPLFFLFLKEIVIGYLIGLLFSLILEAAALAGQLIGVLSGFSATELLDPLRSSSFPLWSKVATLFIGAWIFSWDYHLELIRLIYQSFQIFPIESTNWKGPLFQTAATGISQFFHFALDFAAFPLAMLSFVVILLALMAKMIPELPVFWLGFPIQLFFGFTLMLIAAPLFPDIVQKIFYETKILFERIFLDLQIRL